MMDREQLYEHLKSQSRVLMAEGLDEAFKTVDRQDFVGEDYKVEAYEDYALPIGYDQTISQPTTMAFMLELLDVKPEESVLDVGSGSGWTTALLATLVGKEGEVLGLEVIPQLVKLGQENLAKYDFPQVKIKLAEKITEDNYNPDEIYDKILVSASADELPEYLIDKLRPGGTMVIPIEDSIFKIYKNEDGDLEEEEFPGFNFVLLV